MLRCVGNMKVPGGLNVMMCVLDIIFNFFLIFPTREIGLGSVSLTVPAPVSECLARHLALCRRRLSQRG